MANLKRVLVDPLWDSNPIGIQVLGICSALAVTGNCIPALTMAAGVTLITGCSNFAISISRNYVPPKVQIIIQLVIISVLVIIADQFLQAYLYDVSLKLSVFVGLIITNCIVLGRAKAFAEANPPIPSFLDGIANGLGYGLILMSVAVVRELTGPGTLFNVPVLSKIEGYVPNGMMVLPSAAFFCIATFIWIQRSITPKLVEKE